MKWKIALLSIATIFLSSCVNAGGIDSLSGRDTNPKLLQDYVSGLFSDAELVRINDFVDLDQEESFSFMVDNEGFVSGDRLKMESTLNWGGVSSFEPKQCEYENFWTDTTARMAKSKLVKGMAVKFGTIELTTQNFQKSKVLVLGQFTLILNSASKTDLFFSLISNNLKVCSDGVRAFDKTNSITDLGLKNSPYKNREYFESDNLVLRSAQDELVSLDVYVKGEYSVTFFKIFLNDINMPSRETWGQINEVLDSPIMRVCRIEEVSCKPINLDFLSSYVPQSDSVSRIKF